MDEQYYSTFRLVFEDAPEALAVVGQDGRVLLANRAARELQLHIESLPLGKASGGPRSPLRVVDRGGAVRFLAVEERQLDTERLIVIRDVTEQRTLEEALSHSRRVESLGYVTASVVHDFNNLLMPILCTSALLADELPEDSRAGAMAAEVRMAAERAAALVHHLMRLVRLQPSATERVDVNLALAEMEPLFARGLPEDVELVLSLEEGSLDVVLDRQRLEIALLNLTANARDAMPRGGKVVIATASHSERDDEAPAGLSANGYVSIAVTDNGEGMRPEVRERVFERFFTTKAPGRGTGLGLPAVQGFVAECGGRILVRSEVGEGTTVALYLPRAGPLTVEEHPHSALDSELPGGSETILVVEDDELVRHAIRSVLERYGYLVVEAISGDVALREIQARGGVALAIVDVVMPRMSGRGLVERVRSAGYDPKVLFMSGHVDATIEDRGGWHGGEPILRKAFSPSELLRSVRRALDSR